MSKVWTRRRWAHLGGTTWRYHQAGARTSVRSNVQTAVLAGPTWSRVLLRTKVRAPAWRCHQRRAMDPSPQPYATVRARCRRSCSLELFQRLSDVALNLFLQNGQRVEFLLLA